MHKGNFGKNSLLQQKLFVLLYFIVPNGNLFSTSMKSGIQILYHETWKKKKPVCIMILSIQEKGEVQCGEKGETEFQTCLW